MVGGRLQQCNICWQVWRNADIFVPELGRVHSFRLTNLRHSHTLTHATAYTTTDCYLSSTESTQPNGNLTTCKYGRKSASCNVTADTSSTTYTTSTAVYTGPNQNIAADSKTYFLRGLLKTS
jgi:hypothetical protein